MVAFFAHCRTRQRLLLRVLGVSILKGIMKGLTFWTEVGIEFVVESEIEVEIWTETVVETEVEMARLMSYVYVVVEEN